MHNVPKARLLPPVKFEQICRIVVVVCFARLHIFVICIDTKIQRRCGGRCRRLSDYLITTKVIIPSAIAPRRVHSKGLFPSAASFVATAEDGIARSPMGWSVLTTMSLQVPTNRSQCMEVDPCSRSFYIQWRSMIRHRPQKNCT
jgi:hypothetical protein